MSERLKINLEFTFCLISQELVDFSDSSVESTHDEAMVIHVQNQVLALWEQAYDSTTE